MNDFEIREVHIEDSYKFHLREGYSEVAHMVSVGKKFDRWYDLMWFQKKV